MVHAVHTQHVHLVHKQQIHTHAHDADTRAHSTHTCMSISVQALGRGRIAVQATATPQNRVMPVSPRCWVILETPPWPPPSPGPAARWPRSVLGLRFTPSGLICHQPPALPSRCWDAQRPDRPQGVRQCRETHSSRCGAPSGEGWRAAAGGGSWATPGAVGRLPGAAGRQAGRWLSSVPQGDREAAGALHHRQPPENEAQGSVPL